jgi:glycosyltransferase involved in cell wall biosynthesis
MSKGVNSMRRRVLINASNLHVGGGVQVATSFIADIARLGADFPIVVWASSKVAANLKGLNVDIHGFEDFQVANSFGVRFLFSRLNKRLSGFDVVFTVFGPLYSFNRSATKITGFAQGWVIYPANEVRSRQGRVARLMTAVRGRIQGRFFALSDVYVVESGHVKRRLRELGLANRQPVEVIPNCVSPVFFAPHLWAPLDVPYAGLAIKIGFLGRNYLHKNLSILPAIRKILWESHGVNVEFFVTFRDDEWRLCSETFRSTIRNVGELSLAQCPSFYNAMDAIIFPSLLECFSATPLEAMAMRKQLFVSDRPFNRDVCGDFAHYIDPLNPVVAAGIIAEILARPADKETLDSAELHARTFSSSTERTEAYLKLIRHHLN